MRGKIGAKDWPSLYTARERRIGGYRPERRLGGKTEF